MPTSMLHVGWIQENKKRIEALEVRAENAETRVDILVLIVKEMSGKAGKNNPRLLTLFRDLLGEPEPEQLEPTAAPPPSA